jgi:hypothetical protein
MDDGTAREGRSLGTSGTAIRGRRSFAASRINVQLRLWILQVSLSRSYKEHMFP